MARIGIDKDERYPDYLLLEPGSIYAMAEIDVPDTTLARWRAAIADYEAVQDEMEAALDAALGTVR